GIGGEAADPEHHEQPRVEQEDDQERPLLKSRRSVIAAHASDSCARGRIIRAAKVGTTSRVRTVAVISPPITTVASGFWTSAPAPGARAMGMKPTMATSAVVRTARMRLAAPWIAALGGGSPPSSRSRIACIRTRPFRVATPETAMNPTAAETEK